jgi:hypothetical protein
MLFALGFGLMGWSYRSSAQARSSFPLRVTLLIPRGDGADKPADGALPVSVRFLPLADSAAALVAEGSRQQGPDGDRRADRLDDGLQVIDLDDDVACLRNEIGVPFASPDRTLFEMSLEIRALSYSEKSLWT